MKKIIAFLIMMSLFGCTNISATLQPTLAPANAIGDSVSCAGGCTDEWERAELWIVKHSKWKIQSSTNVSIQTFYPRNHEASYGFTVTKEPSGGGNYIIMMELSCGNALGCDPKPIDVKNAFYYYVKNGNDLLPQRFLGSIR